ncbi:MAG TPA: hypothetical protein VFM51_00095 [Solirubrobacterales bacterium]|nr:hypothetical protein [Solirubrobacterales bacterium]
MTVRMKSSLLVALIGTAGLLLLSSSTVSAKFPIAKNGKIHACYKAKGKKRGQLRMFRGARVSCPKKWRRISWYATNPAGVPGSAGPQGQSGTAGNVAVEQLEDRVDQLLTRVEQLETLVPTVAALCTQAATLTNQVDNFGEALGDMKLNAVLTTLGGVLEVPTLPGAMGAFSCPS